MAYLKIIGKGQTDKYMDADSYETLVHYCCDPSKALYTGCSNLPSIPAAAAAMAANDQAFHKTGGKKLVHIVLTFDSRELSLLSAQAIQEIAQRSMAFFAGQYCVVYAIHGIPQPHIHLLIQRTSFVDGRRYPDRYEDRHRFWLYLHNILANHGIRLWK